MLCSAHEVMYWPGMQAAILQDSANCFVYASYSSSLPKEPMLSHETPHGSRKFISQELFKQSGRWYAVTVDHYRKVQQSFYRTCVLRHIRFRSFAV